MLSELSRSWGGLVASSLQRDDSETSKGFTWALAALSRDDFNNPTAMGRETDHLRVDHVWTNFRGLPNNFQMILGSNGSFSENFRIVWDFGSKMLPDRSANDLTMISISFRFPPGHFWRANVGAQTRPSPWRSKILSRGGAPLAKAWLRSRWGRKKIHHQMCRIIKYGISQKKCAGSFGIWLPCPLNCQAIPSHLTQIQQPYPWNAMFALKRHLHPLA